MIPASRQTGWPEKLRPGGRLPIPGVVPLDKDRKKVMLLRSKEQDEWLLPTIDWESDEKFPDSAVRGRRGGGVGGGGSARFDQDLGDVKKGTATFSFYEATVVSEETKWPQVDLWERQWFTFADSHVKLRSAFRTALERSNIKQKPKKPAK
ncbi:hypothetical protein B0T14DRAFT_579784 [Immersiella caudata]|uniref:Nudix hydrolase domain-containing protein n=1 Tax=Immersiella caudata TaxID=314043 RepID=A0AA40C794_9PEZI|nr:hypothetical protein B0T14DRAFT_579784 [Immersiella caudata]